MSDYEHGGARPGAGRRKGSPATPGELRERLVEARGDREAALAGLADLELRVRRGELLEAEDVVLAWSGMLAAARSRLLALPTAVAGCVAPADRPQVLARATRLVHEALDELAGSGLPDQAPAEPAALE